MIMAAGWLRDTLLPPFTMQKILRPKRNGTMRVCYNPDPELKRKLRALVPQLNLLAEELDVHHVQHGFTEGRSPVTNAKVHIGFAFTVSFDLENFFDTVTVKLVSRAIWRSEPLKNRLSIPVECWVDGAARQGLPTSPALANIAASPMDRDIMALCPKGRFSERPFVYSRYADDLTFSCHTMATVELLKEEVPKIVERHGFKTNAAKTKVQAAVAGRRIITGVAVGQHDITIPREVRRKIRAAYHQDVAGLKRRNIRRILFSRNRWKTRLPLRARFYYGMKGLVEWGRLKLPKQTKLVEPKNVVVRGVAKVVAAVAGQAVANRFAGAWTRRFG